MLLLPTIALGADWNVLQTDQVLVRCRPEAEHQRCEARASMAASPAAIQRVLEDIDTFAEHFATIDRAERRPDGGVELIFGLPWFLGDWQSTSRPSRWTDEAGWHLALQVVESRGRTALFDTLQFEVHPVQDASSLTVTWTHAMGWPAAVRDRITRQQGHNLVWGIAMAVGSEPGKPDPTHVASEEAPR